MMRMTFGTVAGISVIALVVSAFWPDGRPGPSPRRLAAKDKPKESANRLLPVTRTRSDADQRADDNLQKRIDVNYIEIPFNEVLDDLGHQSGLQFYVKLQFLDDYGIPSDFPVTLSLNDVSVETALDLILEQLGLTRVIRDGVLLITTEEDSESFSEVRVYNCRDLLEAYDEGDDSNGGQTIHSDTAPVPSSENKNNRDAKKQRSNKKKAAGTKQSARAPVTEDVLAQFGGGMGGGGGMVVPAGPASREERLMNIITLAVMPESWEDMGGPGAIGEFDGMVVIRHNRRAHRQVEQVLQMLRDASGQHGWANLGGGGFF